MGHLVTHWIGVMLALPLPFLAAIFTIPSAGCPMAHCTQGLTDFVGTGPSNASFSLIDTLTAGSALGLGCTSNTRIVACSFGGDPTQYSNLVVYDGDGNRVFEDGGVLDSTAWASAPLVGMDGTVIAADDHTIMRVFPYTKQILWKSQKPDNGIPISPVLVGPNMVLLATKSQGGVAGQVSVWDTESGQLLNAMTITDPRLGAFDTQNTPAVSGNRAYVLMAAVTNPNFGRLYAIDVCVGVNTRTGCTFRGQIRPAWFYGLNGPSGSSPLLIGKRIFFDGRSNQSSLSGVFMAIDDAGTQAKPVWQMSFPNVFLANAAQDPSGGIWVFYKGAPGPLKLDENTGATIQTVTLSQYLGSDKSPSSGISVTPSPTGGTALTLGAASATGPSYVLSIDVTASKLIWSYQIAESSNWTAGQFPVVINSLGARRTVFAGNHSSAFFVGEP